MRSNGSLVQVRTNSLRAFGARRSRDFPAAAAHVRDGFLAACAVILMLPGTVLADDAKSPRVRNGDFETADEKDSGKPAYWSKPDGLGVQWTNDAASAAHGKCIRMDTSISEKAMVERWKKTGLTNLWDIPNPAGNAVAETYGLSYYSDGIPVQSGQAYRVTFDFKGPSGGKLWVTCYGVFEGEKRRRYEKVVNAAGKEDEWMTQSAVFHPTKQRPEVTEMKVMLYAYYPAGIYWFDNIRSEPISDREYERAKAEKVGSGQ